MRLSPATPMLVGFIPSHGGLQALVDRKSTRLNSSHQIISYAVFCLKKKNQRDALGGVGAGIGALVRAGPPLTSVASSPLQPRPVPMTHASYAPLHYSDVCPVRTSAD